MFRVGMGYDVHRIVEGRELWLGGIKFHLTSPHVREGPGLGLAS